MTSVTTGRSRKFPAAPVCALAFNVVKRLDLALDEDVGVVERDFARCFRLVQQVAQDGLAHVQRAADVAERSAHDPGAVFYRVTVAPHVPCDVFDLLGGVQLA